eukprot:m.33787 g.33787  ORF g.33787 m.33787 type:complete len:256 (-) comp9491_c0_seq2:2252-3019(-)
MAAFSLNTCDGVAYFQKATLFALPFGVREQVSAMVLTTAAAKSSGSLAFSVSADLDPVLPEFGPEWPRALWGQIEHCFPSTEAVAHSLHDDELESEESDSEADSPGRKASTLKKLPAPVLLVAHQTEAGLFVCSFQDQEVGAPLEIVVAVRHRRLDPRSMRLPSCSPEATTRFLAGAHVVTANTTRDDGGREPREMLQHMRRTLATGSLTRIVEPTCSVSRLPAVPGLQAIECLRSRKVLATQLTEEHVVQLEES